MSKKFASFATVCGFSILAAQTAGAADLASVKAPAPVAPPPAFTWTGVYAGVSSGYGGEIYDATVSLPGLVTQTSNRASGFTIGGELGYNYQIGNFVLGAETDGHWSNIKQSHQATTVGIPVGGFVGIQQGINWFGSTRARLGYAFGRVLPYVTGGVAYGEVEASGVRSLGETIIGGAQNKTNVGWVAGGGLDIAVSKNAVARAEYVYLSLPGLNGQTLAGVPGVGPVVGAFSTGTFGAHIFRGGMNWKFDGLNDVSRVSDGSLLAGFMTPANYSWTGFYAGISGGYAGGWVNATVPLLSTAAASTTYVYNRFGGLLAGGQAGYDHQFGDHIVLGAETDAHWTDMKTWHQEYTGPAPSIFTQTSYGLNWFGTTRARAGWAAGDVLYFATGGVAYGEMIVGGAQIAPGAAYAGSSSIGRVGWTVGGGAEYRLSQNIALRADYLYMQFNGTTAPVYGFVGAAPVVGQTQTQNLDVNVTRIGVNWRFGDGVPAVVAKY